MKKLLMVLILASLVLGGAYGVDFMKGSAAMGEGISIDLGVGYSPFLLYDMEVPPIHLGITYNLASVANIPLSIGVFGNFATSSNGGDPNTWLGEYYERWIAFGARANWHYTLSDAVDTYIGVTLGWAMVTQSNDFTFLGQSMHIETDASTFFYGACLGLHWYFTKNFGLFAEVGYSALTVANIGLALKF